MKHWLLFFSLIGLWVAPVYSCDVIYVNQNASGTNNGTSWTSAYTDLQDALSEAASCNSNNTEIWVAQGTYLPTLNRSGQQTNSNLSKTFVLNFKVQLYGGFAGHETDKSQRILHLHETKLSADHLSNDIYINDKNDRSFPARNIGDNSLNILRITTSSQIIIDGFTFQGGFANSDDFTTSVGAAIYIESTDQASLDCLIKRCSFLNNSSSFGGGAIYNYGKFMTSSPIIDACIFKSNKSRTRDGGAIYNIASGVTGFANPIIISSLFYNNWADNRGGAIYNFSSGDGRSIPYIDNCTFVDNLADIDGGAIFSFANSPGAGATPEIELKESIFYQNIAGAAVNSFSGANVGYDPRYCNYPEAMSGNPSNNTSVNPLFVSSTNFRLQAISPLIDQGQQLPSSERDLDDNARVLSTHVDIGAYEFLSCPPTNIIYVNDDAPGQRTGSTSLTPMSSLNMALTMACHCSSDPEIRVAAGQYIPHRLGNTLVPQGRANHYEITKKLKLLGGYAENFSSRDINIHQSIIDGDINGDGSIVNNSDNIKNLMIVQDDASGTLIEGLTLVGGNETNSNTTIHFASAIQINASSNIFNIMINRSKFLSNHNNTSRGTIHTQANSNTIELSIDSCDFVNNTSADGAACINFFRNSGRGLLNVANSRFESNTSSTDGAITYISNSDAGDEVLISDCHFEQNSTLGEGSCIHVEMNGINFTRLFIEDSDFIDNSAEKDGGAIYVSAENNCIYNLKNSFFRFNSAKKGGAYYYRNNINTDRNDPSIINCIFANNSADFGGAVELSANVVDFTPRIINSSFLSNTASINGGGINAIILNGSLEIYNCAFWQNSGSSAVNSFAASDFPTPIITNIRHSLIQEADCNHPHLTNVNCGSGMIFGQNPQLNSLGIPLGTSPLINAGLNGHLRFDLYDHTGVTPRILQNNIDIGAIEFEGPCLTDLVLNPSGSGRLEGAHLAKNSITVMPGFNTNNSNWLILDAPVVTILSDYSYNGNQFLKILQQGCN